MSLNAFSDAYEMARDLRSALARLNRRLRAHDEPEGIGSTGLSVLGRLARGGASSAASLASAERLQPQSLTRTLQALETRGLIAREADHADRRRSAITITIPGIEFLRTTAFRRESWLANAIAATLSSTERDLLRIALPLLERLADADQAEDAVEDDT